MYSHNISLRDFLVILFSIVIAKNLLFDSVVILNIMSLIAEVLRIRIALENWVFSPGMLSKNYNKYYVF